jgi:hypothetical protein
MFSVLSRQAIGVGNYRGIKSKSIFFRSRAFSGLNRVSNSVEANAEFIRVNSKVWHSGVIELGETMSRAIVIVIRASL